MKRVLFLLAFSAAAHAENIGIYSGTFDPPHLGHAEVITTARENFSLDKEYVIVNVTSDHKKGVQPFEKREKMAKMAFGKLPGAVVADEPLEKAFEKGDMPEVFKTLRAGHPDANL